ncbi:MAG TPA: hypothetical protein VE959_02825 [Bryobacteraceae bacterium]|nr:hypothetical protein [Bryobacteraceae bacterium]
MMTGAWSRGLLAFAFFAAAIPAAGVPNLVMYAATNAGVFTSIDRAVTWTPVGFGLGGVNVFALAIDPSNPLILYAGTAGSGVFKSTDGGQSFAPASVGLSDLNILALAIDPSSPKTIYAATAAAGFLPGSGLFKSTDGAQSWTVANSGLPLVIIETVAIDPANTAILYAGTNFAGVFKSFNGGQTWAPANVGMTNVFVSQIVADPSRPSAFYASTSGGVFHTIDAGVTWTAMNSGFLNLQIESIAVDPASPTNLYAGTNVNGVFKSLDGGNTWLASNPSLLPTQISTPHLPLAIDPVTPGTVYAGAAAGVFKNSGGPFWTGANNGLPAGASVFALALAPLPPPALGPSGVFPESGNALSQTFTFSFTAPSGFPNLGVLDILINNAVDGRHACYLAFALPASDACPVSQCLFLVDDAGDSGGPFAGSTRLGAGNVQNSQCAVTGPGSYITGAGNTVALTLPLAFTPAFAGNQLISMAARDNAGNNSGWQPMGTWSVPGQPPPGPEALGVSPAHSTAATQSFTFTFSDPNGFQDISVADILINTALDGRGACYVAFVPSGPSSGTLFLVDDAGDAGGPYAGGVLLPGSVNVRNSQCTLNAGASSVSASGNLLTLTLSIGFDGVNFAGNRAVFLAARSNTQSSGWQPLGTVLAPSQ